jgi:hypothetical protein
LCRIPDHSDHLPIAARLRFHDQAIEQRASDALLLHVWCDVYRIFDREAVRRRATAAALHLLRELLTQIRDSSA